MNEKDMLWASLKDAEKDVFKLYYENIELKLENMKLKSKIKEAGK